MNHEFTEISTFLGITISMCNNCEKSPRCIFVEYGEYVCAFSVEDLRMIEGQMPPRVTGLIIEWMIKNKSKLIQNFRLGVQKKELKKILGLI